GGRGTRDPACPSSRPSRRRVRRNRSRREWRRRRRCRSRTQFLLVIWLGGVARAQVLSAAGDLLVERGFDQLDLTAVAQRARVGKTTIYRRWGSVTRLIGDLLSDMAEQSVPRAATGSLRGDLR